MERRCEAKVAKPLTEELGESVLYESQTVSELNSFREMRGG